MSRSKYEGVGRNDPCPCESGKKFKKCCFEKAQRGFEAKVIQGGTGRGLGALMQSAAKQQATDQEAFEKKQREKEKNGESSVD